VGQIRGALLKGIKGALIKEGSMGVYRYWAQGIVVIVYTMGVIYRLSFWRSKLIVLVGYKSSFFPIWGSK